MRNSKITIDNVQQVLIIERFTIIKYCWNISILLLKKILQKFPYFTEYNFQKSWLTKTRVVPLRSHYRQTIQPGDNHRSPNIPRMIANYRVNGQCALSQIQIEGGSSLVRNQRRAWSPYLSHLLSPIYRALLAIISRLIDRMFIHLVVFR